MTAATVSPAASHVTQKITDPNYVSYRFVEEYYTIMSKDPSSLHCFYDKDSTVDIATGKEAPKRYHGQQVNIHVRARVFQEINDCILAQEYQDCLVAVLSMDCQVSANGGLILMVIGTKSNKGGPYVKFMQTFFLAEQSNGYFILNDVCRVVDDAMFLEAEVPVEEEQTEEQMVPEKEIVEEEIPVQPVEIIKEEIKEEVTPMNTKPSTWAKLAGSGDMSKWGNNSSSAKGTVAVVETSSHNSSANSSQESVNAKKETRQPHLFMIFMRNMPDGVTNDDLKKAFDSSYSIKKVEINKSKNYGIVEFTNTENVASALGKKFMVKGREVVAEERRAKGYTVSRNTRGHKENGGSRRDYKHRQRNDQRGGKQQESSENQVKKQQ